MTDARERPIDVLGNLRRVRERLIKARRVTLRQDWACVVCKATVRRDCEALGLYFIPGTYNAIACVSCAPLVRP
jgi:hypothetical protein